MYFIRPRGVDASTHIFRVFVEFPRTNYVYDCARVRVSLLNRNTFTMLAWGPFIAAGVHSIDIFGFISLNKLSLSVTQIWPCNE